MRSPGPAIGAVPRAGARRDPTAAGVSPMPDYTRRVRLTTAQDSPAATIPLPGITVVMASYGGRDRIGRMLDSLSQQTLDTTLFEVVVVLNGPDDGTADVLRARREAGERGVRVVRTARAGASHARNLGVTLARHEYLTFVDDDDWVSPRYLAELLEHAAPGVVALATLADVDADTGVPTYDNYLNRAVLPYAGTQVPFATLSQAASANSGKVVATAVARATKFDTRLGSGEDVAYWATVIARSRLDVRVLPVDSRAVYYRLVRAGSVSRSIGRPFVLDRIAVIATLRELVDAYPSRAAAVRRLIDAQGQHIGRYLAERPDERRWVLDRIAERDVPGFPYPQVNMLGARDLVIAYAFAPYVDTSAMVVARRVALAERPVDVLMQDMTGRRPVDVESDRLVREVVGRRMVVGGSAVWSNWRGIETFCRRGMEMIEAREAAAGAYESVYSRAMWPASHVLAALYKVRHPETPWIAEFSDPLQFDAQGLVREGLVRDSELFDEIEDRCAELGVPRTESRNLFEWIEKIAFALADRVVFTNENQLRYMLDHAPVPALAARVAERAEIAQHPTLPPEYYRLEPSSYRLDRTKVNIGYFGVFYAVRGVGDLLGALDGLTPEERDHVVLHVFTDKPEDTRALVEEHHLASSVRVNPYVPYFEFLALSTQFDWLLVADARVGQTHGINPYLPSKLSDYRGSGARIWALVEPGSVLDRQPVDAKSAIGDVGAVRDVLRHSLDLLGAEDDPRATARGRRAPLRRRKVPRLTVATAAGDAHVTLTAQFAEGRVQQWTVPDAELGEMLGRLLHRAAVREVVDRTAGRPDVQATVFEHLYPVLAPRGTYRLELADGLDGLAPALRTVVDAGIAGAADDPARQPLAAFAARTAASVEQRDGEVVWTRVAKASTVLQSLPLAELAEEYQAFPGDETYHRIVPDIRGNEHAARTVARVTNDFADAVARVPEIGTLRDAITLGDGNVVAEGRYVVDESMLIHQHVQQRGQLFRVAQSDTFVLESSLAGDVPTSPGTHVVLKQIWDANYGHWLIDAFSRFDTVRRALPRETVDAARYIVSAARSDALRAVYRDSLLLAGVDEDRIVWDGTHPRRWQRLVYAAPLARPPLVKHPRSVAFLEELAREAAAGEPSGPRRIYLSRNQYARRRLLNEDEVLARLEPLGYVVVHPEQLSLVEQARLFAGATHVAGNMGAAFTNLVFAPHGVRVLCLATETMQHDYFYDITCHKNGTYAALQGTATDRDQGNASDFTVDLVALDEILADHVDDAETSPAV